MEHKRSVGEIMKMRKDALHGYIKCQQGISVLGLGVFCQISKIDPAILDDIESDIKLYGTMSQGSCDELIFGVLRDLMLLKIGMDDLVDQSQLSYSALVRKYKCKNELLMSPGPELPRAPLSSFENIALYVSQLLKHFESVMMEAGPIIATNRIDGLLAMDVQGQFEDLRRSLVAAV